MKHEHMISFRLQQVLALCKLTVAYVVSLFCKKKRIWLVAERGVDARDNGYVLYKYMRSEHPEIECYYIISSDSPDKAKLTPYAPNVIAYRSFAHYVMLWRASVLISTHVQGYFPFVGLGLWCRRICPAYRAKCHVNVKHGITKDHVAFQDYSNTHMDLLIAGVKPEYNYFMSDYLYPKENVKLTGFCRFDQLVNTAQHKQVLLMPTWREWLYKTSDFYESEYVQTYVSLLNNSRLQKVLEQYNMNLVFYPHHEVQKHIAYFKQKCQGKHIIIADKNSYDVQQLLKESDLLITDYSSVYFDFAYMRKPTIYYLFDYDQYRSEHYAEGWFDYFKGLGVTTKTEEECISQIEMSLKEGCIMQEEYKQRVDEWFPYQDQNNCQRVFDAICVAEASKKKGIERC